MIITARSNERVPAAYSFDWTLNGVTKYLARLFSFNTQGTSYASVLLSLLSSIPLNNQLLLLFVRLEI